MAITISELPASLPVEPGAHAACTVTVANHSEIVDEYAFEVLGAASEWTTYEPETVSLLPGTHTDITLTFRPPRDSAMAAGPVPVGFKAASVERPDTSTIVEGALEIQRFRDIGLELFPRTSHGSHTGKHELAIDNRGNAPSELLLNAKDPDNLLRFRFSPPVVVSEPGTATFAKVRVTHRKRFLRGPTKMRPFEVIAEEEGQPPVAVGGQALQDKMLPSWALGAVLALGVLALVWAFFLQPKIKDTAQVAAKDEIVKNAAAAGAAGAGAGGAGAGGAGANSAAANNPDAASSNPGAVPANPAAVNPAMSASNPSAGAAPSAAGAANGPTAAAAAAGGGAARGITGTPVSKRLVANCPAKCTDSYTVPGGKTLAVVDVIMGNPTNTKGTLTLKNGDSIVTVENLDNFRDLDFHFGQPIIVSSGKKLSLQLKCPKKCSAAVFFTGQLVTQVPKLRVTQAVPNVVDKGDKFDYGLAVTNTGDTSLKDIVLTERIPGQLKLSTPDVSRNNFENCELSASNELTCTIGSLGPGDSASITLNVIATADGGATIQYTARGTSKEPALSNTSKAITKVAAVDLSVSQEGPETAAVGDLVTYTITVKNDSEDWATDVMLKDELPAGLSNVTANGCEPETQSVTCSLGPMAPNEVRTIVVTGQAATEGTATGTATVTTMTTDSDTGNNTAQADIEVTPQQ